MAKQNESALSENKGELIIRQAVDEINSEIPKIQELFDIAYEYNRKDSTRTELSQKCTTYLLDVWQTLGAIVDNYSPAENNEDTISREAYEQIKWERDTAIQQLKDLGYGLGEKPKDNKGDLISRRAVTDIIERKRYKFDAIAEIERLPSVENKGDLISREAVEEMIKAEMPERGMWEIEGDKEKETVCEVCVDLMQKLSALPSAENKGEWIPVSERPPEENRAVQTYIDNGVTSTYCLACWNGKDWEEWLGHRKVEAEMGYKVLAWQPFLPEPYKAESEDAE